MKRIFNKYLESAKVKQIIETTNKEHRVQLKGLIGSSRAFVQAAVSQLTSRPVIIVMDNYVDAAYVQNDLQQFMDNVLFFPSSLRTSFLTNEVQNIDNPNLLLRTEVLDKINSNQAQLIVTYPNALIESVVSRQEIEGSSFDIKVGEQVDVETLEEFLLEYGFTKVDFVLEPGQYAIRGYIVDIFSFASEVPYRIELFGDEVESIRSFDVENQRSIDKLEQIRILPDLHTSEDVNRISFFEFLPKDYILFFNDLQYSLDYFEQNSERKFNLEDQEGNEVSIIFAQSEKMKENILNFDIIELSNKAVLAKHTINFKTSPQPVLQKNFKLLAQTLREYTDLGYERYILSYQEKQLKRIREILDSQDVGATDVQFIPIEKTLYEGFIDHDLKLVVFTDHQIFGRYHRYRIKDERLRNKKEHVLIKEIQSLKPGDYVVHIDYGIGKFAGLKTIDNNGKKQEVIHIVYKGGDSIFVPIHSLHKISKYKGKEGEEPKLHKLGTATWANLKAKAKKKVKDIAKDLIALYAKRMQEKGFAFSADSYLQEELEASFMYEDTPDQITATRAIKADMEKPVPMDRLVCGDVGFGKTEVAIRAAFKAVADNKQVAVLCPTTVLALQHYKTFSQRLKDFPATVDHLSRLKTPKEQKETLKRLAEGKIDIIIGTHRLLSKDVKFKDLGLLIIDEEQKFGVSAKERLRQLRVNVDTLTLTATPIPRTLQFSLMGARDLSIINTPPPNRRPVITEIYTFNKEILKKAICYEINRGGQVFFVHNHVATLPQIAEVVAEVCPKARIAIAHGRMKPTEVEEIMSDFINYEYDVLVTTTIIENGIDIPNANTIIINDAHKFGLSDLHQLRGRVGRSAQQAFCYLLAPPKTALTQNARRRLQTIEQFVELGSGFNIALQDLDIRGAGNLLGAEQSGYINEMGYDTYKKILEEAVLELKNEEFRDLFKKQEEEHETVKYVTDCQISTDLNAQIPPNYVSNDTERLRLYHKLNSLTRDSELDEFLQELEDRFGPVPDAINELISIVRLRWKAMELGFEKIILKNNTMLCYFVSDKNSAFYDSKIFQNILQYISTRKHLEFKQKNDKLYLKFENIKSVKAALDKIEQMHKIVFDVKEEQKV